MIVADEDTVDEHHTIYDRKLGMPHAPEEGDPAEVGISHITAKNIRSAGRIYNEVTCTVDVAEPVIVTIFKKAVEEIGAEVSVDAKISSLHRSSDLCLHWQQEAEVL